MLQSKLTNSSFSLILLCQIQRKTNIPIILGRPFLATERALIDVHEGELTIRVHDQKVTFKVFNSCNTQLPIVMLMNAFKLMMLKIWQKTFQGTLFMMMIQIAMLNFVNDPKQVLISCENSIKEIIDEINEGITYPNFDSY